MEPDKRASQRTLADEVMEVADEVKAQRARREEVVAAREAAVGRPRKRAVLASLLVAAPIFVLVVVTNVKGVSVASLFTPAPSPVVARQQAKEALDFVVGEIDAFRTDYAELPGTLNEIGASPQGNWTYLKTGGGHYRVVLRLHGQVVTYDSQTAGGA